MLSISAVKEKTHSKGVPQTAFYGSVSRFVSSWSLLKQILFFLSWNVIVSLQCLDPGGAVEECRAHKPICTLGHTPGV